MVGEKEECDGAKYEDKRYRTLSDCASQCKGVSSMFAFGTAEFGDSQCLGDATCRCLCETSATKEGTCTTINNDGYRLYKFLQTGTGDYFVVNTLLILYIYRKFKTP